MMLTEGPRLLSVARDVLVGHDLPHWLGAVSYTHLTLPTILRV